MSHGLDEILRYFLLALLWLFFLYAARMVIVDARRSRAERTRETPSDANRQQAGGHRRANMHLRVVEPNDRGGQAYELGDEVTLGRSSACAIALERDTFASSVHARIFTREGEMWLEDLGSRNGTFLNEERLAAGPVPLQRGDRVKVGTTVFEVAR